MPVFDVATLQCLLAIDSATFAVAVFSTIWQRFGDGRREWAVALACQTLGWGLLAAGPRWLPPIALTAAPLLNLVGLSLYGLAMTRLTGNRLHPAWHIIPPALGIVLVSPLIAAWEGRASALLAIILIQLVICMVPLVRRNDKWLSRTSRGIVIAAFALGAAGVLLQFLSLNTGTASSIYTHSPANSTRFLLAHLNIVVANIGIALLYREHAMGKLSHQANLDPLTELFNRASFIEQAGREIQRAQAAGAQIAALIVNIDAFKNINQRFGQLGGDRLLRHFAKLLVQALRSEDLCARWSGASFAVLMIDSNTQGARLLAARLAQAVETSIVEPDGIRYGISVGIADGTQPEIGASKLFTQAETARQQARETAADHAETAQ